ncbi:MAG TPA: BON domain-containing protein [Vicinamibacterales bacterium]|nr:BON domain-containing protein [Vicinamibacterales bacterium]
MADYRRHFDDGPRRHDRDWSDRPTDEGRGWFDDRHSRYDADRSPLDRDRDDRTSRWEGVQDDRPFGTYRTDDRDYHERYRTERPDRSIRAAASEYYRAARDQRDDYLRWSANNMGTWGEQHLPSDDDSPAWRRERGGYWRRYESNRPNYQGRGPKGYQRSDDRIREEVCDCMTDDPMLDASEIDVVVVQGEVTLTGSVPDREQKRRAEDVAERISGVRDVTNQLRVTRDAGHNWASDSSRASGPGTTSSPALTQASGKGTPSKSTSGTTA